MYESKRYARVLLNLTHGEHAVVEEETDPAADTTTVAAATGESEPTTSRFDYLFKGLRDFYPGAHLPVDPASTVVTALKALGSAMVEQAQEDPGDDSTIPPVYTYWGQFVDHDLTANTDRDSSVSIVDLPLEPMQPERVRKDLANLRQPQLNLDSVYGNGPDASGQPGQVPYTAAGNFVLGALVAGPPVALPGDDLPRDVSADTVDERRKALIGDGRNDENLVIAQLHLSFLKFHNAVRAWFAANPGSPVTGAGDFDRAKQLVQWHYQWVTIHDFLRRIARTDVVDGLLDDPTTAIFNPPADDPFMPLEFSIAAYRFGHSMVRGSYDWNENFGAPNATVPSARFDQLFQFTGNGRFIGPLEALPSNWPARFERLTGAEPTPPGSSPLTPPRVARKINTHLAPPLNDLRNEGSAADSVWVQRILKRLAVRNLLRGYRLALPTGQAVAASLGIVPLTAEQILGGAIQVKDALIDGGFVTDTPLWFYVLREAEVLEGGDRLGPVGSRIVAETIIGQVRVDPDSFMSAGWTPAQGVTLPDGSPVDSIAGFLRFAGMHP